MRESHALRIADKKKKKKRKKRKLSYETGAEIIYYELGNIANEKRKALDLFDVDKNQIRKQKREGFSVKIWKGAKKKKKGKKKENRKRDYPSELTSQQRPVFFPSLYKNYRW